MNTSIYMRVCYPRIVITGQRKAGTTALYALLEMHPNTLLSYVGKENCFASGLNYTLLEYFETLEYSPEPNQIFIDGCPDPITNMALRKAIFKDSKTLYIFLTRDYASLLWSGYNYWCDPGIDEGCNTVTKWTDPSSHIRSPDDFDEMIQNKNGSTSVLAFLYNALNNANVFYKNTIHYLYENVGEKNVCKIIRLHNYIN